MTHLTFNGECEAAFHVYADCLDGVIAFLMKYGESPVAHSPETADKILHATLKVGGQVITGVDVAAEHYEKPRGFSVQLNIDGVHEAHRVFETFAEGGVVHMPIQPTFWAEAFGIVTDRFGTPWEVNCGNGAA